MSQHNLARVNEVVEGEVVAPAVTAEASVVNTTDCIQVVANIVIAPANTDNYIPMLMEQLSGISKVITQLSQEMESMRSESNALDLSVLDAKLNVIVEAFDSIPEWIPANTLQESSGLKADAIRLQLQNPARFEPGKDYKKIGRIWYVHKNSMAKIRRQK